MVLLTLPFELLVVHIILVAAFVTAILIMEFLKSIVFHRMRITRPHGRNLALISRCAQELHLLQSMIDLTYYIGGFYVIICVFSHMIAELCWRQIIKNDSN